MSYLKLKKILPVFFILSFIAVLSIPNNLFYFGSYTPEYILCITFYYLLLQPNNIPLPTIIFLGAIYDIVMKYPTGIHILLFLLLRQIVGMHRKFLIHKNFKVIWLFFGLDLIFLVIIKMIMLSYLYNLSIKHIYFSNIMRIYFTILIYPSIHLILDKISKIYMSYEKNR